MMPTNKPAARVSGVLRRGPTCWRLVGGIAGLALALIILGNEAAAISPPRYSIDIKRGLNLIANQLEQGQETIDEVIPVAPNGTRLFKFNNVSRTWETAVYFESFRGWEPGHILLRPGEGAFLESPEDFRLTFEGFERGRLIPVDIPPGECYLLSRQLPQPGDWDTIVGTRAPVGAVVYKWNPAIGGYDRYNFEIGFWEPFEPITAIGESAWFCPDGGKVPSLNQRPTITDIPNQSIDEDTSTAQLTFTINDAESPPSALELSTSSSNPTLVPAAGIVLGGTGNSRTVTVTPAPNQFGSATITVTVTDPIGDFASDTFNVNVKSVNDPPTISNIPDQTIVQDTSTGLISFTIADLETITSNLVLTASTSNSNLVPLAGIAFTRGATTQTVKVTPAPGQFGTNTVTVTVTDAGNLAASDNFVVIVQRKPPELISVEAICSRTEITVRFSEPVHPVSSLDPARYQIVVQRAPVPVVSVEATGDPAVFTLHLGAALVQNALYTLDATIVGLPGSEGTSRLDFTCNECVRGSAGAEFWLTFPGNYAANPFDLPSPQLFISGNPGTEFTVSAPGLSPPFLVSFAIPEEGVAVVGLPREADLGSANDVIQDKGIQVIANDRVTVHGYNYMPLSTDGYLALPVATLGRAYTVMTYQNLFATGLDLNGVQLAVVATDDSTTVTVVPSASIPGRLGGVPFSFTLERGQTYQLLNTGATPVDLTGTLVLADKPIAVFSGHQCASIPNTNDVFLCDHLVEQLPPGELWGTEFLTLPLETRGGGDTFRFLARFDDTTVSIDGTPLSGHLARGKFHEIRFDKPAHIAADRPILVAQFANSSDFDSVADADPFMLLVPPTGLFATEYSVHTPYEGFGAHYISIVAPEDTPIVLDGKLVEPESFAPIADSGFAGATLEVNFGPHILSSPDEVPFGVVVYGWNTLDSYGYPAGLCQTTPDPEPPVCPCPPETLELSLDDNCVMRVPDMSQFLGSCYLFVTQNPPAGQILRAGTSTITTTIFDQLGNQKDCVTTVTTVQPSDIFSACQSQAGTIVQYPVPTCGTNNAFTCTPPPGTLFPVGTTPVTCVASNRTAGDVTLSFKVTVECLNIAVAFAPPNQVIVTWAGNGILEVAPDPTGPWTELPSATSPFAVTISPAEPHRFYRVRF